tara:strand:+ start:414 stop:932 length:519 start_codon:yes stop_codon:yes gene_type:complete
LGAAIGFVLSNFTAVLFVVGLVAAWISLGLRGTPRSKQDVYDALLAWFLFFSIGVSYIYNFVMHVFFGKFTASFIGWADSPFQAEVGYASLGFAAVGFLAFRSGWTVRLAAVLGPSFFLWGAAVGHAIDMVKSHNFAPGNAGTIFWSDILLPVVGFALLWLTRDQKRPNSTT